jgi:hypothetical protein
MTRRRRRNHQGRTVPPMEDSALRASAFRMSARDPLFWGWCLARLRDARGLTPDQPAQALSSSGRPQSVPTARTVKL